MNNILLSIEDPVGENGHVCIQKRFYSSNDNAMREEKNRHEE